MKQKFSRFLCLALALVMALSLCACGKDKGSDDPNHLDFGKYTLDYKGACIMVDEAGDDAVVLTFQFTNNAKEDASYGWSIYEKVTQDGTELESSYVVADYETYESVSESYFTNVAPGESIEIRLPFKLNGTGTVEVALSDLWDNYTHTITVNPAELERETVANPNGDIGGLDIFGSEGSDPTETEAQTATGTFVDWWAGDWYGWWIISSGTGDYSDAAGYWWDVCARIVTYDAQSGQIVMWDDDDRSIASACCVAQVSFNEAGTGEHGTMMSESGAFMDQVLGHADWIVDPGLEKVDDLIWIDGTYYGETGSYSYDIYLRPWGVTWDDITEEVTGYENPLPNTYDWYLSFINAGQPMPDSFDATVDGGAATPGSDATEATEATTVAAPTGNMIPFTIAGETTNGTAVPVKFSIPEGTWDMEDQKFAYNIDLYNCPDTDEGTFDVPRISISLKDNEEKLNFYVDQYENLSETEGRTIGGIEMKGRKYDYTGYEQLQEYYGVLPSGVGVSIRLIKVPDSVLPECYAILDTLTFN